MKTTVKTQVDIHVREIDIKAADIAEALAKTDSDAQAEFFLNFSMFTTLYNWCGQSLSISESLETGVNKTQVANCLLTLAAHLGVVPVDTSIKNVVHALEGSAMNTDEDPRWRAACELRKLQNWESGKIRIRGTV